MQSCKSHTDDREIQHSRLVVVVTHPPQHYIPEGKVPAHLHTRNVISCSHKNVEENSAWLWGTAVLALKLFTLRS
jgi:hypothetical protein